jgi:hypothetical protein
MPEASRGFRPEVELRSVNNACHGTEAGRIQSCGSHVDRQGIGLDFHFLTLVRHFKTFLTFSRSFSKLSHHINNSSRPQEMDRLSQIWRRRHRGVSRDETAPTETHSAFQCQQSALLNLPAELRNKIYEYALTVEPTADPNNNTSSVILKRPLPTWFTTSTHQASNDAPPVSVLSLFRVCRQMREDTEARFYSLNPLEYHLYFNDLPQYTLDGYAEQQPPNLDIAASYSLLASLDWRRLAAIEDLTISTNSVTHLVREVEQYGHRMSRLRILKLRPDRHSRLENDSERLNAIGARLTQALLQCPVLEDATVVMPPDHLWGRSRRIMRDKNIALQNFASIDIALQRAIGVWQHQKAGGIGVAIVKISDKYMCANCGHLHWRNGTSVI